MGRAAPDDHPEGVSTPQSDTVIVRRLWMVLCAAVLSLFPFTVYSTFLVPIAEATTAGEATVGAFRGLGGISAVVVGVAFAPLLGSLVKSRVTATALLILALSCAVATTGHVAALVLFCLGVGSATALLTPALLTIATEAFSESASAGRAATLVTAVQTLAAVLAAPVIGALALWQGWRGALWVSAAIAVVLAAVFVFKNTPPPQPVRESRYRDAFSQLRRRPDLTSLIAIAALRTTSFMGYLAYLAAYYNDTFDLPATTFVWVWTLSGASFFAGNYVAGRWASRHRAVGTAHRTLLVCILVVLGAVIVTFTATSLIVALIATALMGIGHAVVAAIVTTLIARNAGELTASAFSMNAAGMSLGVFAGAILGAIGLATVGFTGIGIALALPMLAAAVTTVARMRQSVQS